MSMDGELKKHYALLLGIGSPWEVKTVDLKLLEKQVVIELGWQWGAAAKCPECGGECSMHDCAPERTWRHLDTMQFTTLIRARTPRSACPQHGVKTMQVPWAVPQGRFTLLFERFAVDVLLASASVKLGVRAAGHWLGHRARDDAPGGGTGPDASSTGRLEIPAPSGILVANMETPPTHWKRLWSFKCGLQARQQHATTPQNAR